MSLCSTSGINLPSTHSSRLEAWQGTWQVVLLWAERGGEGKSYSCWETRGLGLTTSLLKHWMSGMLHIWDTFARRRKQDALKNLPAEPGLISRTTRTCRGHSTPLVGPSDFQEWKDAWAGSTIMVPPSMRHSCGVLDDIEVGQHPRQGDPLGDTKRSAEGQQRREGISL